MVLLFEEFNENIDFDNLVKNHLSQYPFLSYTIKEDVKGMILTFSSKLTLDYLKGILDPFYYEIIQESPVKVRMVRMKHIEKDKVKDKIIIGNIEYINIPKLQINNIEAKIDTGATISSLHSTQIKIHPSRKSVSFIPLDSSYTQYKGKIANLPLEEVVRVQSSNGAEESRPMVKLKIIIQGKEIETFFSLTNREDLEYPILLGRDALSGKFLVDSGRITTMTEGFNSIKKTKDFFMSKTKNILDLYKDKVIDILNFLDIKLDEIYFKFEKLIKSATNLNDILFNINNIIKILNELSYLSNSDIEVIDNLILLKSEIENDLNN